MRTPIIMTLFAIVLLFIFNPEMEDFKVFIGERSEEILLSRAGGSELGRVLSDVGSSLAGSYVDRITERENYFLFSTYRIDLDGPDDTENEWRFLGIGGQFIEMEQPTALEEGSGAD